MDFAKVVEVYYTVSPKIFLCKTEVKFVDKPNSFFILDKFVVDDDFKIVSAEAHFHPFQVGAPRPEEEHKAIDEFCGKFAAGLHNPKDDALLNLFAENGSWSDPVRTRTRLHARTHSFMPTRTHAHVSTCTHARTHA